MLKKILAWCVLVLLVLGSLLGIIFTIKYYTEDKTSKDVMYIQTLENRIDDLEEERIQLLLDIAELEEDNAYTQQLREQVEELAAQIESLQEELTYKNQLLEAYENADKLIVEFYSDDKIHEILLVNPGETINENLIELPTKIDYRFDGWALKGTTEIVDLSSTTFTENTTFVAIFSSTKEVLFSGEKTIYLGDGQTLYTETITKMLSTEFTDISFSNDIQVTLKVSVHSQNGEAGGCEKTTLQPNKNIVTLTSTYGDWGTLRLTTNGALVIDLTDLYSVYYGSITIYEIVRLI